MARGLTKETVDYVIELSKNQLRRDTSEVSGSLSLMGTILAFFFGALTSVVILSAPWWVSVFESVVVFIAFAFLLRYFMWRNRCKKDMHKLVQDGTNLKFNWKRIGDKEKEDFLCLARQSFREHPDLKDKIDFLYPQ